MIDHVSVAVRNLGDSADLYERLLAPLGFKRLVTREATVGFGKTYPEFWLNARPHATPMPEDMGYHVCLRAPDIAAVSAFHAIALQLGCRNAGEPGVRQAAMTSYFGAFILDGDGNKIEAVCFPKKD